jgi:carbamoyltransferase
LINNEHGFSGVPSPGKKELRNFAWVMAVAAGLVAGYAWYDGATRVMQITGGIVAFFVVTGLAVPIVLKPLYLAWMALARILAFVNTHILLALVFYSLFTLIGGIMRLVGRDPLDRKLSAKASSYWHRREQPLMTREHYERQF